MTTPVTPVPDASLPLPDPSDLGTWPARMAEMHRWMRENLRPGMNALAAATYENALVAVAVVNMQGAWAGLTGGLDTPATVVHNDRIWLLLTSLADVTTSEPGVSVDWLDVTPFGRTGGVMQGDLTLPSLNGGQLAGHRNKVVNGNFTINQENVSGTVVLAAGAYGHDQWKAGASGCTYTFASSGGVTTLTITAGSLIQPIEGANLQTGNHVLSWQGTAQGKIGAGAYAASGVTASVTGGADLNLEFSTGTLSLVQLERGTQATPFEHRGVAAELQMCQRYFEVLSTVASLRSITIGAGTYEAGWVFRARKRATPTIQGLAGGWSVARVDASFASLSSGGSAGQVAANVRANARL